jgi:DNA anti-recombination protein RmuC
MPRPRTPSPVDQLRREIRASATRVRTGFRREIRASATQVQAQLREEIHTSATQVRDELRQEIRGGDAETRRHMDVLHAQLLERMDAMVAENRRHFGVVAEQLRGDIKVVAEGLGALDEKLDRFRGEVGDAFGKMDHRILHLQVRVIGRSEPS